MFSGIVEEMATVVAIKHDQENIDFTLSCSFVDELSIDQSVAHNGVCLTVVEIKDGTYTVTAMKETLDRISDEYETATITRKDGKNIILMSEDTYNNLITNIATMGNKANYDWLTASKEQLEEGKAVSHPLESEGKK